MHTVFLSFEDEFEFSAKMPEELLVKAMNSMKKKEEEAPAAPPEPSNEEKLLAEIRDALKK